MVLPVQQTPSIDCSYDSSSGTSFPDPPNASEPELARKESQAVNRTKCLVYLAILLFAVAISTWSHFHLKQQESHQFRTAYESDAEALLKGAERNAQQIFSDLDSLSEAITSHGASWPNATVPNFDKRTTRSVKSGGDPELYLFAPIVTSETKRGWEAYAWARQDWIKNDLMFRQQDGYVNPGKIPRRIHPFFSNDEYDLDEINVYAPIWQVGPTPTDSSIVLLDLYSHPSFRRMIDDSLAVRHALLSEVVDNSVLTQSIQTSSGEGNDNLEQNPRSYGLQPVYDGPERSANIVGFLFAMIRWDAYFLNILSSGATGLLVDVRDTCGSSFSYIVDGPSAEYFDSSNNNHSPVADFEVKREFAEFLRFDKVDSNPYAKHCSYQLAVRPTHALMGKYQTDRPIVYPILLFGVFVLTALIFGFYDLMVRRRNTTVMDTANKTTALVASLFPKEFQDRVLTDERQVREEEDHLGLAPPIKHQIKHFLQDGQGQPAEKSSTAIADLYPSASVIFADMCGFTSWSSTRDPSQVFYLLETVYSAFDEIAKARRVYKVETIGDCWMGACGLPEVRKNHAVAICRFAHDIIDKMNLLVRDLEVELGPDTAELGIRVGIHSGQVTAGVLRGERARFQLFGDTVNTASRMESTGMKSRVQISEATKQHLVEAGKAHWALERQDKVVAKGKGEMQTYWLKLGQAFSQTSRSSNNVSEEDAEEHEVDIVEMHSTRIRKKLSRKDDRLVQWNTEQLIKVLRRMKAKRQMVGIRSDSERELRLEEQTIANRSSLVVEELQDVISLPEWKISKKGIISTDLDPQVNDQLMDFVSRLALMYRENPFHSFAHASHVTMSATKLFSRIIHPSDLDKTDGETLHDHTYGLTSDPLTHFSVIFSALIHDVDHPGVPNAVLVAERDPVAQKYQDKSPAEQRSVDCAWELLQQDRYHALRRAIYCTKEELHRFRQLVVCCIMSTDICDKQLGAARKERWSKAFADLTLQNEETSLARNRKATIVLEHLIQASDVSHTMQHWHVYRRWNECLFVENMKAYQEGRTTVNPVNDWYKGELGFFDFYVIPTAKKLADCGVFGVSSDEYLNYAIANRNEWEIRGREVVDEMAERFQNRA